MRRARIVLFGLLALSACKSKDTYQGVFVDVRNPADVAGIVSLLVHLSNGGTGEKHVFPASGASGLIEFPATLSLTVPASRSGEVDISVDAMDSANAVVANGASFAALAPDSFKTTIVNLQPDATTCGNGQVDLGETCDDGDRYSGDGCSYLCQSEMPGDAAVGPDVGAGGADGVGGGIGLGGATGAGGTAGASGTIGNGGRPTDAGVGGVAGAFGADGATDTAGTVGVGGSRGTGGAIGPGGALGTGGTIGLGGTVGMGGRGAGGAPGTGGTMGTGGRAGTGGRPGTGGAPGSGGAAPPPPRKFVGNIDTRGVIRTDFVTYWDQFMPENAGKWGSVQGSSQSAFSWSSLDAMYKYCTDNKIIFKQRNFIWGAQQPTWTTSLTTDTGPAAVQTWMRAFCARYPNTQLIDVVDEPPPHTTPQYLEAIGGAGSSGYDWIVNAFTWAHEACPGAILILNDYNNAELTSEVTRTIEIVNAIKAAGAPIGAVGCETHGASNLASSTLKANIDKIASSTGLPVYITQYDISFSDDNQQLQRYQDHFPMFMSNENIKGVTVFGYIVGATWQTNSGLMTSTGTMRPAMTWLMNYLGR